MEKKEWYKNVYGHMMIDYYVDILREIRAERQKKLKSIKTRKEAERYQEYVLSAIKKAFPLPEVKLPLNPKTTGVLEQQGYRIEKILFESRPEFLVTGNLYIPDMLKKKVPGVLVPCGHAGIESKAYPLYQEVCIRLVKSGFVVFTYDPISQGERDQYCSISDEKDPLRINCCYAHNMMGKQLELLGDFFGAWRVWDGIRALDYLLSRDEVDKESVGITGNSGGGTLTTWLWALDDRLTIAAPSCFVTTFLANLENELPSDNEQCPPNVISAGLEQADFFIARAPRPVLFLGQRYDFFDIRGLQETYSDIKNFYRLYRAEDNVKMFIGNNIHGYFPDDQKEMLKFFCRHTGLKVYQGDAAPFVQKKEALWATKCGQVVPEVSKPVWEIISKMAKSIAENRKKMSDEKIVSVLKKILNINIPKAVPHYRVLRPFYMESDRYITCRYAVETESSIVSILYKKTTDIARANVFEVEKDIHLFIPHISAIEDMENEPMAGSVLSGSPLYALDVRGIGVSMPKNVEDFSDPYGYDYMLKAYGLMLGKPYLGQRVYDVLMVLNLLKEKGAKDIYLYGRGQGSLIALFAGVFYKDIKKVVLKNYPPSFYQWTQTPSVLWPDANFPPGVIKYTDIPELLGIMGKKVELLEPWGPGMEGIDGR
ncbi:MAG: acetylxylan esterase [Candidatus Ratteibacteria bacterium]|nr:acetylxylan esterase [Candidatus Ratteibacteria bacterium]